MSRTATYILTLSTAVLLPSCQDLRLREIGVCGNGIVEPDAGEDCDSSEGCVAPDRPQACLQECDEGTCPDGSACGLDGICRAQGDAFDRGDLVGEEAWFLDIEELDADGRAELAFVNGLDPSAVRFDTRNTSLAVVGFDAERARRSEVRMGRSAVPVFFDSTVEGGTGVGYVTRAGWGSPGDGQGFQGVEGVVIGDLLDGEAFVPRPVGEHSRERAPKVSHVYSLRDVQFDRQRLRRPGVVYGGNLWIVREHADEPVFPEPVPALGSTTDPTELGWAQPLALHPERRFEHSNCGIPCLGSFADLAIVEGESSDQVLYAGPIGLYDVGAGTQSKPVGDVPLPQSAAGFLPWVAFAQMDAGGAYDLVAATTKQVGAGDGIAVDVRVAYGVGDGTFHSDPTSLPDADGDMEFSEVPAMSFYGVIIAPEDRQEIEWPARLNQFAGMRVVDLNDDQVADLALERTLVVSGPCSGECSCGTQHDCRPVSWTDGGIGTGRIDVSDVDGDGWPEVRVPQLNIEGTPGVSMGALSTYVVEGDQVQADHWLSPDPVHDVVTLDLDADGNLDTVVRTGDVVDGADSVFVRWGVDGADEFRPALGLPMAGSMTATSTDVFATEDLMVAASAPEPGDDRTWLLLLSGVGDQVLTSPLRPTDTVGDLGWTRAWTHAWVINPNLPGQLWVLATNLDALPEEGASMFFYVLEQTTAGVLDVVNEQRFLPLSQGLRGAQAEALDFDGDGVDELVAFASSATEDASELGCTTGYLWDFSDEEMQQISQCIDILLAPRPPADGFGLAGRMSGLDVDQDGDLDLVVAGNLENGEGPRVPVVWEQDDGQIEPLVLTTTDGALDDLRDWAAWFAEDGDGNPQLQGVFATGAGLATGAIDLESREVTVTWQEAWVEGDAPAPTDAAVGAAVSIDTGDLDGDGLIDFAVTTAWGPRVYWGTRTTNPT